MVIHGVNSPETVSKMTILLRENSNFNGFLKLFETITENVTALQLSKKKSENMVVQGCKSKVLPAITLQLTQFLVLQKLQPNAFTHHLKLCTPVPLKIKTGGH